MEADFILTVNRKTVQKAPILRRSLKFNTTLLQVIIIAKALSIELSEEHIEGLLQDAWTDQRDEYRQLRQLYADYRIGWGEILSKLGIEKRSSAPLENLDEVDQITDAWLKDRLGDESYTMFETANEMFNESLYELLTAVHIETDLSFHEESDGIQLRNSLEERMMNFVQTKPEHNRQVLEDEVINIHYPPRHENTLTSLRKKQMLFSRFCSL